MILLQGNEIHRVKLKRWIELEDIKEKVSDAVGTHSDEVIDYILKYVSTASGLDYSNAFWIDTIEALTELQALNVPKQFPILKVQQKPKNVLDFHYEGREWYFWLNLFAAAYGWTVEYIENLDIDDAIALLQEIVYDEVSDKEWNWMLSDVAYEYDKHGKGKLREFKKPPWIKAASKIKEPMKVKIRKDLMPVGNVISADEIKRNFPQVSASDSPTMEETESS